jgi:hypothetical protein
MGGLFVSARPSRNDQPEVNRKAMRLIIDLDLDKLPNDHAREVRRILGFWTAWLPKMDLTQPTEQELQDVNYQAVGMLRLIEANATDKPEAI